MCAPYTFRPRVQKELIEHHSPMLITDEAFECFRQDMEEKHGEAMTLIEAKQRYLNLMHLFWILAHKVPTEGDPPHEVPLPPWL